MIAARLVVFFVAAIFLQQHVYGFNNDRIQGGSISPVGMFQFLPALSFLGQGPNLDKIGSAVCSSTVISKRHILTAAHCTAVVLPNGLGGDWVLDTSAILVDFRPREKIIDVGKNSILDKVQLPLKSFGIQLKFYNHPSFFTAKSLAYDISVIEFPVGTDLKIPPIKLVSNYVEAEGDTAIAAGYGIYKYKWNPEMQDYEPLKPTELLNATVPIFSPENCPLAKVTTAICIGAPGLQSDHGDSGGPLMFEKDGKYYQIGITSAGANGTVFYTRLSDYCEWIKMITNGDASCEPLPADINRNQPLSDPDIPPFLIPANEPDVTAIPLPTAAPQSSSSFATFNILFLFFVFFLFA